MGSTVTHPSFDVFAPEAMAFPSNRIFLAEEMVYGIASQPEGAIPPRFWGQVLQAAQVIASGVWHPISL